ncbi:MAG: hypothetical protein DMG88_22335 [Acidobacteria bacterium]|nr:MAG: hypothetical protein DMG88_22335 [Acidobacteriota bacterium]
MNYFHWIAGCLLGVVWFSRLVDAALGVPSIADISRPEWNRTSSNNPRVSIIVPARNEEHDIEQTLRRLLALDYDNYEVIAVDDRSSDRTGEIITRLASSPEAQGILKAVNIEALPSGWVGKTHAMWTAGQQATGNWLLRLSAAGDCLRRSRPRRSRRPSSAHDHESAWRKNDDRLLSHSFCFWSSSLESRRSKCSRPHGGRRFQPHPPQRI